MISHHTIENTTPTRIIRAKCLFWLASIPDDALNFSQAGGSTSWCLVVQYVF
ncbi:MAG: GTP-binding protein [Chryseobacterium sp.]